MLNIVFMTVKAKQKLRKVPHQKRTIEFKYIYIYIYVYIVRPQFGSLAQVMDEFRPKKPNTINL